MDIGSIGWTILRLVVHGCAGVGVFFGIYQILELGCRNRWVNRGWNYLIDQTSQVQQKRDLDYRRRYEEMGLVDKVPWLQRWDQMFAQSMLQQRFPRLNAQLFGCLLLMAGGVSGIAGLLLLRERPGMGILTAVGLFMLVLLCGVFYMSLLRRRRWIQTERELVPFLNIIDNFSKTEQDLFQIFDMAVPYLREPVKTALLECCRHASSTGNRMEAIRDLLYQIEHPKFREMIQTLEVCSRNQANYGQILGDMRAGLSAYMSNRKEEEVILREGQIQMIVIICLGIPMIAMLSGITKVPLRELPANLFGICILLYWAVLLLVMVYQMFFAVKGKEIG